MRGSLAPSGPLTVYFGIGGGAVLPGMVAMGLTMSVAPRARPVEAIGPRE